MKKITLALMCILLSAGAAMSQKKFTFGPKIGVDFTHFWGKHTENIKGVFNYQAGVFFEYRFTDKFSIAPEAVFAAQGANEDLYDTNLNTNTIEKDGYTQYNTNYVNIPVMFKYYVIPSLSIDLGPQLGINVYSKLTYNISDDVFVQGRYTLGLTKAFKTFEGKNGNAQIAIGYRF